MSGESGKDLRQARRASGMPFGEFAKLAGFSEPYLRNVENGTRVLTLAVAQAYDRVLSTGGVFAAVLGEPVAAARPWDRHGTLAMLTELADGGGVDRRGFIVTSGAALAALAGHWRAALDWQEPPADAEGTATNMSAPALLDSVDVRLDHLRHMNDELGSNEMASLARNELALLVQMIKNGGLNDPMTDRAYSLACEASRQVGWNLFDAGHHAAAQWYFGTALRASAAAKDPVTGAYAMSLMAVQHYTAGEPKDAVKLLESAQDAVARKATPRMKAMLAARKARAISKTGDQRASVRALGEARHWWEQGTCDDDAPQLYWVTAAEIEMIAGSSALQLNDPAWALHSFQAAIDSEQTGDVQFLPRWHAIYLTRAAEAHLGLHDLDAAVETGRRAAKCLGSVDSARSLKELTELRTRLEPHRGHRAVREFLEVG